MGDTPGFGGNDFDVAQLRAEFPDFEGDDEAFLQFFMEQVMGGGMPDAGSVPAPDAGQPTNDKDDVFANAKKEKSPAVVTIELVHPRNFGLDWAVSSQATGFVVDKEKGIILSNKHVVGEGPCRAKARFMKHEELDLLPIYRDPVHDYGFFTFDPSQLTETPKVEIELDPEGAVRGRNALIIGNNGGERLSFVATTIARTDRTAVPMLDMNTFYVTASDTGVGGSSGAPLLSTEGKALAMMASGNDGTNISMYLPLFRVQRALEFIRRGEKIPRGTLQVAFKYQTFDQLKKRRAIDEEIVKEVKAAHENSEGLLIVEKNLPKGPGKIAGISNGDVLLRLNGNIVCNYVQYEEVMDTFIGKPVQIAVMREGKEVNLEAIVQDQDEFAVTRMVEVSNGIFHGLQYKVACAVNLPIEGVFVAKEGYMFRSVPFASIIKRIGKKEVHNLDDFVAAVKELRNAEVVTVRYQPINDKNKIELATITVDKRWYPFELATRNDKDGSWDYEDLNTKPSEAVTKQTKAKRQTAADEGEPGPRIVGCDPDLARLSGALVQVKFSIPFNVDGNYFGAGRVGCGIVVDKRLGLVITSREQIGTTLVDVQLVFNLSKTIEAKVVFIHPEKPFSLIKYDPELLADDRTVQVEEVVFSEERPVAGEELNFVGVTRDFEPDVDSEVKVRNFRDADYYGGEMQGHKMAPGPFEVVGFGDNSAFWGFYLDKKTKQAKAFSVGGGASVACDVLQMINEVQEALSSDSALPSSVRLLPITVTFHDLSEARINDLPDKWAEKLQRTMTLYQQKLIVVKRRMATTDAYEKLKENDLVLAVDGKVVTLIREFMAALEGKEKVSLKLIRDYEEFDVEVETTPFSTLGTTRILHFGGLILQDPHPAIYYLSTPEYLKDGGVYVSFQESGSPAESSQMANEDLTRTNSIIAKLVFKVNGEAVRDLEEFLQVCRKTKHNEFVRLIARDIKNGEESVHDIRLDLEYWKTRDMYLDEKGDWKSKVINHDP